jgi:hypothetical protein
MDANIVGMAIRGGTIYYCAWEKGLKKRSLGDNSVSDIINRDMTAVYYVAASEDIHLLPPNPDDTATLLLSLI